MVQSSLSLDACTTERTSAVHTVGRRRYRKFIHRQNFNSGTDWGKHPASPLKWRLYHWSSVPSVWSTSPPPVDIFGVLRSEGNAGYLVTLVEYRSPRIDGLGHASGPPPDPSATIDLTVDQHGRDLPLRLRPPLGTSHRRGAPLGLPRESSGPAPGCRGTARRCWRRAGRE
jgi:hypothetical protein